MTTYRVTCNYCDFSKNITTWDPYADNRCDKCGDRDLKPFAYGDQFGYDSDKPKEDAYIKRKKE